MATSHKFRRGDRVRVAAHVATKPDESEIRTKGEDALAGLALFGKEGEIRAANPTYEDKDTGQTMVSVELDGGFLAGVPEKALQRVSGRTSFGPLGDAWDRVFGGG